MRRATSLGLLLAILFVALAVGQLRDANASPAKLDDVWLIAKKQAESRLKLRFVNIRTVTCSPIRSSPNQIFGTVRYWQRYQCSGLTRDSVPFRLNFKATGQCSECWTISQLTGIGIAHLRKRSSAPSPSAPPAAPPAAPPGTTPPVTTARCRIDYANAGRKVGFDTRIDFGRYLLLKDGSIWVPSSLDRYKTSLWSRFDIVIVVDGSSSSPCRIINLTKGSVVNATRATARKCAGSYYPNGGRIVGFDSRENGTYGGSVLFLQDGSVWETALLGSSSTILWMSYHDVVVLDNDRLTYPCVMVNLDRGDVVEVKRIG
jgi:hypothetical protein